MPLTKAEARRIALSLPGTKEGLHYGKPAIFLDGEFLARVHDKEDAVVLIIHGIEMRDMMLEAERRFSTSPIIIATGRRCSHACPN